MHPVSPCAILIMEPLIIYVACCSQYPEGRKSFSCNNTSEIFKRLIGKGLGKVFCYGNIPMDNYIFHFTVKIRRYSKTVCFAYIDIKWISQLPTMPLNPLFLKEHLHLCHYHRIP